MSAYRKDFDETKYISFLTKDDELLKKYNEILEKVENSRKKEFDKEPVYNLKAKVKSYNGKISTNFHNNKIHSQFICLSVILIDSVFSAGKNYYPQVFLEECKYAVKEKKIPKYIIDNIYISSDFNIENPNEENSDEENSDKKRSDEETSSEENWYEEN